MGSILNAETDINPQAPANQAKKGEVTALTSDNKLGYGVPDEQQRMADMISQLSGFDPTQQVPTGADDVLPPNYYNPTQNQSVILGSSGGLGGNSPLMSAGIPMFSPSVLQQADEQLKEAEKLKYESDMSAAKDLIDGTIPLQINDDSKNLNFLNLQNKVYGELFQKQIEQFGTGAYQKGKFERNRVTGQMKALQQGFNNASKMANDILVGKTLDKNFVHDDVYKIAKSYNDWVGSDLSGMTPQEIQSKVGDFTRKLVVATSLKESTEQAIKGIDKLTATGNIVESLKEWGKSNWFYVEKKGGTAAFDDNDVEAMYDTYMENYYDTAYGAYKKGQKPTRKQFDNYVYGASKYSKDIISKSLNAAPVTNINIKDDGVDEEIPFTQETVIQVGKLKVPVKNSTSFRPSHVPFQNIKGMVRDINGEIITIEPKNTYLNTIVMYDGVPFVIGTAEREVLNKKTRKMETNTETVFMPLTTTIYNSLDDLKRIKYQYTPISGYKEIDRINSYIDSNKAFLGGLSQEISQQFLDEKAGKKSKTERLPIAGSKPSDPSNGIRYKVGTQVVEINKEDRQEFLKDFPNAIIIK